jgi:hypothetical protein
MLSMPFEWIRQNGFRMGFDVAFGRAIGGEVTAECSAFGSTSCDQGEVRKFDRRAAVAFSSSFLIGWSLGKPEPAAPAHSVSR